MNLWVADQETWQPEGVSPGVKWSRKTFSCPHFYCKTLALNLCARWSGCWLSADVFTVSKSKLPPQNCSLRDRKCPTRYGVNFQCLFKVPSKFPAVLWSPLSRCSIQKECALGLLARSWISMGEGPQQCPSMTLTPPEISVSADIKVKSASLHASVTPATKNLKKNICFRFFSGISLTSVMWSVAVETLVKFFDTSFARVQVILNQLLQFWLMSHSCRGHRRIFTCPNICLTPLLSKFQIRDLQQHLQL